MKRIRLIDFTRYFLAFLCSFFIFTSSILIVLYLTLLQPTYLTREAEKADYYSLLTREVNRYVQDVGLGSGIPESALVNAISEKTIESDSNEYFIRAFIGMDYELSTTEIEKELEAKIKNYAAANDVAVTSESETGIQLYVKKISQQYSKFIKLPYLVQIGMRLDQLRQIVFISAMGSLIGLVLVSLFLLKALKWGHRLYRYLSYAFIGGGLMLLVFPIVILASKYILRIGLTSKALYQLVTTYLTDFFQGFIYGGALLILIGILFIILSEIRRSHVIKRGATGFA